MKYTKAILIMALSATLLTGVVRAQDQEATTTITKAERTRMDSVENNYMKEGIKAQKEKDESVMKDIQNDRDDTKAKAKEAQRIEKDANSAAKESKNALKAEKKAQRARKSANKQADKASEAREKSDKNN
jgi:hypothetical protein